MTDQTDDESVEELAVRMAAAAHHADADQLLDSNAFRAQLKGLGINTLGYMERVADLVRDRATGQQPAAAPEVAPTPEPTPAPSGYDLMMQAARRRAELTTDYSGDISVDDVQIADPAVVAAWADSGRLAHFGVAKRRRR